MKSSKKVKKILIKYYTEITDTFQLNGVTIGEERYIVNEGGKTYLVEEWK